MDTRPSGNFGHAGQIPTLHKTKVGAVDKDQFVTVLAGKFPKLKEGKTLEGVQQEIQADLQKEKEAQGNPSSWFEIQEEFCLQNQRLDYDWTTAEFVPTKDVRQFFDMCAFGTEIKVTSTGKAVTETVYERGMPSAGKAIDYHNHSTDIYVTHDKGKLASGRVHTRMLSPTIHGGVGAQSSFRSSAAIPPEGVLAIQMRSPFCEAKGGVEGFGISCGLAPGRFVGDVDDFGYQTLLVADGVDDKLTKCPGGPIDRDVLDEWFESALPETECRILVKRLTLTAYRDGDEVKERAELEDDLEEVICRLAPQVNMSPMMTTRHMSNLRRIDVSDYSNANGLIRVEPPFDRIVFLAAREPSPGIQDKEKGATAKLMYGLRGIKDASGGMGSRNSSRSSSNMMMSSSPAGSSSSSSRPQFPSMRSGGGGGGVVGGMKRMGSDEATSSRDLTEQARLEYRPLTETNSSRNDSKKTPVTTTTTTVGGGGGGVQGDASVVATKGSTDPASPTASSSGGGGMHQPTLGPQDRFNRGDWQIFENEILGRGGFGEVYKAFNTCTGSFAAAKLLKGIVGDPKEMEKLVKELQLEIEMLTNLAHDNVVRVYDGDTMTPPPCIFLEWMPGGSVSTVMRSVGGSLPVNVVAKYTKDVLAGLKFLHENKVLHRDLKPANMLVGANGDVKLSDFGLCKKIVSSGSNKSSVGQGIGGGIVGTVPYLAPECLHGKMSRQSDIWAVGCSVVEMLSGDIPWKLNPNVDTDNSMALIFAIGTAKPPDHHPKLPNEFLESEEYSDLRDFLTKCFAFEASSRPSCEELLAHPFLQGS